MPTTIPEHADGATAAEDEHLECNDCGVLHQHLALRAQRESARRLLSERRVLVLYGSETGNGAFFFVGRRGRAE